MNSRGLAISWHLVGDFGDYLTIGKKDIQWEKISFHLQNDWPLPLAFAC